MKMKADSSAVLCGFLSTVVVQGTLLFFIRGSRLGGRRYAGQNGAV